MCIFHFVTVPKLCEIFGQDILIFDVFSFLKTDIRIQNMNANDNIAQKNSEANQAHIGLIMQTLNYIYGK